MRIKTFIKFIGTMISFVGVASTAAQMPPAEVERYLQEFHVSPRSVINQRPYRTDEFGRLREFRPLFTQAEMDRGDQIRARKRFTEALCAKGSCFWAPSTFSEPFNFDRVETFFDNPAQLIRSVAALDKTDYRKVTLAKEPWSDSYWPMAKGLLGLRFGDDSFPDSDNWFTNFSYVNAYPASVLIAEGRSGDLSPSEKYDALVGDSGYTLTATSWRKGQAYYDQYGYVAGWMGICHGWAGAAINLDQPVRAIQVPAVDGTPITFYPSDIKGLASLLWASYPPRTRLIGGRCTLSHPPVDEIGRVIEPSCLGTNPATWHMAVINHVGRLSRSMVMDATFDAEVWNYPIYAYEFSYFNPQNLQASKRLSFSIVAKRDFTIDKFRRYRSARAAYFVGVSMTVTYMEELQASRREGERFKKTNVTYIYDLELDSQQNVVGGEWYTNLHPDFLWTTPDGVRARTSYDANEMFGAWNGQSPIPSAWQNPALRASARNSPLAAIVERLVELSR